MKVVGVCGYGATGSSAVVALLKEYEEFNVCDRAEIQEAFKIDGLQDLDYHLNKQYARHMSGDVAIKRFLDEIKYYKTPLVKKPIPPKIYQELTSNYINSLIQGSWIGIDNIDYNTKHPVYNFIVLLYKKFIFPAFEKITKRPYNYWPARKMYLSIRPENFYEKTKTYTDGLIKAAGGNDMKTVVFDQVFEGNAPQNCFPYFRDPAAIVVDRDPRDLWLAAKYAKRYSGEARFMPRQDVKVFVEYYRKLRQDQNRNDNKNILFIQFEDIIYNYNKTVKRIEKFLNCNKHSYKRKFFQPDKSIYNTQLFNNPKYQKSRMEIEYIEKELQEYLFDFDKYPKLKNYKQAF